jgi:hypothetical protein
LLAGSGVQSRVKDSESRLFWPEFYLRHGQVVPISRHTEKLFKDLESNLK